MPKKKPPIEGLEEQLRRLDARRLHQTQWFSVEEAAVYLRLSRSFLDKKRVSGGGPKYHKLGAKVVYSSDDLDAWRTERGRSSTAPERPSRRKRRQRNHVTA